MRLVLGTLKSAEYQHPDPLQLELATRRLSRIGDCQNRSRFASPFHFSALLPTIEYRVLKLTAKSAMSQGSR